MRTIDEIIKCVASCVDKNFFFLFFSTQHLFDPVPVVLLCFSREW